MLGATAYLFVLSLSSAFSAYLLWGWFGLIAVNTYLYGFMVGVPYVQIFALTTLLLILLKKDKEMSVCRANGTTFLMITFAGHCFLAALFAYPGLERNWELYSNVVKTLLFCLLMPVLTKSRYRFHALLVIIVLGIGFHGILEGLKFIASGGAHASAGVKKLGDNNHFAMVLVMTLPLLLFLFHYAKHSLARLVFAGVFVLTCLATVATGSRGALITLVSVGAWLILLSRRKGVSLLVALSVGAVLYAAAPERWTARMNTIQEAETDSSFMGRVTAWKRASAIALENPIFGGGFHAGQDPVLFVQFRDAQGILGFVDTKPATYAAATHSIYFEVLGDLGFVGLLLFLALMLYPFVLRVRIRSLARVLGPEASWAADCSDLLAASMVAYLVGGAALSAAYFELPYILVMLMQVLFLQLDAQTKKTFETTKATFRS